MRAIGTRWPGVKLFQGVEIGIWTRLLLGVAVAFCLTISARADFVSGRVFGPDGRILPNTNFTVEDRGQKTNFTTDNSGNFSVYLDPGTYTVRPSSDASLEGVIHGYPQSTTEDIHLKRK